MIVKVEDIRKKWSYRVDADEENENQPKKKKHSAFSTRLPYGLCKDVGIDTEGMTPREAWDAYYGKTGISPEDVKEEKFEDGPKEEKTVDKKKTDAINSTFDKIVEAEEKSKELKGTSKYTDYEKSLEAQTESRKAWADAIEANGYDLGAKDLRDLDDDELEEHYNRTLKMGKHAVGLYIDGDERSERINDLCIAEKNRIIDEAKKRLHEKREEETGDNEDVDMEDLGSLSDAELESLDDDLYWRRDWYADKVRRWSGKGAEREAARSIRNEMDAQIERIAQERDRRAEVDLRERIGHIGDAKPTVREYKNPVMQEYAKKVKPPTVHTDIPTLNGWQKSADAYMDNTGASEWGKDAENLERMQNNLQKMFDNAEFCVNINSANVEKVFSTHLKNQFETGTTDGSDDLEARARMSRNIFGTPLETDDEEREKFGFMADKDDYRGTLGASGPGYGEGGQGVRCTITLLKDNLANRTTYTFHDSLSGCVDEAHTKFAAGMVDTNCSIEGMSYRSAYAQDIADGKIKTVNDLCGGFGGFGYIECQYHGLVTAKDIDAVRFKSISDMRNAINAWGKDAMEIAKKNGIRFAYYDKLDGKFVYMDANETAEKVKKLY